MTAPSAALGRLWEAEAEANEAAAEALVDVQAMLRLHSYARAGLVLGGAA